MKLQHRGGRQTDDPKWKGLAPHRLAFKGCVLADDILHKSIRGTAEAIEARTGMSREKTAYLASTAGMLGAFLASDSQPDISVSAFAMMQNWLGLLFAIDRVERFKTEQKNCGQEATATRSEHLNRMIRFPVIAAGIVAVAYSFLSETASGFISATGSVLSGTGVMLYLLSASSGILQRITDALRDLAAFRQAQPKPIKIRE